jgi:hypothetical protein
MKETIWVEVYSNETLQTRLRSGYASNEGDLFVLLCSMYLSLQQWHEVYMCEAHPGQARYPDNKIVIYSDGLYRTYHAAEEHLLVIIRRPSLTV